jgi:hypothetical protein
MLTSGSLKLTGHHHSRFVASLKEFRRPLNLGRSGDWLLDRTIDGIQMNRQRQCAYERVKSRDNQDGRTDWRLTYASILIRKYVYLI